MAETDTHNLHQSMRTRVKGRAADVSRRAAEGRRRVFRGEGGWDPWVTWMLVPVDQPDSRQIGECTGSAGSRPCEPDNGRCSGGRGRGERESGERTDPMLEQTNVNAAELTAVRGVVVVVVRCGEG